jgi:peptide/nickel transport system substrate-binding protein
MPRSSNEPAQSRRAGRTDRGSFRRGGGRPRDETTPKPPVTGTPRPRAALAKLGFAVLLCLASLPAQAEKVVRAVLNTELAVLDPIATTINATRVFAYLVFDQLVAIDSQGKYHPQMLEGWQISDDKLTYTFTLRDGLLWSDGTPVTATDCVASIKRWGKRDGFAKSLMAMTKDLRVTGDKTFVLELAQPFAFVIEALGKPGNNVPVMMPARLAATDPGTAIKEPIGSGPFTFRQNEWRPGELAIFDRNPNYKPRPEPADGLSGGKKVNIDRVEIINQADVATRMLSLQSGGVDLLEYIPFDYIVPLRNEPKVVVAPLVGVEQMLQALSLNHAQPPFNNLLARRAVQAALDQAEVMASLGLPEDMYLKKCLSIYLCNAAGTSDAGLEYYQDAGLDRAKALLKESGYNGERVVLLHAATSASLNPTGLVEADILKRIGFNVDIQTSDFATVAARRASKAPVSEGGWSAIPVIWNGIDLVNPLSDPAVFNNCNEYNPGWYCDEELTELLRQYALAPDEGQRRDLAGQIQKAFHRNVNFVLGGQLSAPMGWRADLKGVIPFAFPVFWNMDR